MGRINNFLAKVTAGTLPTTQLWRGEGQQWDANGVSATTDVMAWAANVTPDGTKSTHSLTATSGIAVALAVPTSLIPGVRHLFIITNASGGAMGALTFAAGYLMPAAVILPANGETIALEFEVLPANPATQLRQIGGLGSGGSSSLETGVVTPAWGAAIAIDRTLGNVFNVIAADNTAYTYGAPSLSVPGDRITIRFQNASGVTSGAGAFNAVFALRGPAIPALANGVGYEITFVCIAAAGAGSWVEESRAAQLATTSAVLIGRQTALGGPYEEIPTQLPTFAAGAPFVAFQFAPAQALTNAQFLTLPTAAVALAAPAAPGAGFFIYPIAAWFRLDAIAGAYTNVDPSVEGFIRTQVGTVPLLFAGSSAITPVLTAASSNAALFRPSSDSGGTLAAIENRALELFFDNNGAGDFTGGNAANSGTLRVLWGLLPV